MIRTNRNINNITLQNDPDVEYIIDNDVEAAIASKQNIIIGAATTITDQNLTANKAVVSSALGKITVSNTTSTEIGYLSGLQTGVQGQLDGMKKYAQYPIKSIKSYGAVGDGVVDDTLAIQAAIDSITGPDQTLLIPMGKYRITSGLIIDSKTDLSIVSEGGQIFVDANVIGLSITNNTRLTTQGKLRMYGASKVGTGLKLELNIECCFNGLYFDNLDFACLLSTRSGIHDQTPINDIFITTCNTGIFITGEYYELINPQIRYCRNYGIRIQGGNNPISGGQIVKCRIGIFVEGGILANSDHSRISGTTINHCIACGIFLKNVTLSYHIVGCEIWAIVGERDSTGFTPFVLSETRNVEARAYSYGIYIEDSLYVNIVSNVIANSKINVGIDAINDTNISNNTFQTTTTTVAHLKEFGDMISTYNSFSAQNTISYNTFDGGFTGSVSQGKRYVLSTVGNTLCYDTRGNKGGSGKNALTYSSSTSGTIHLAGEQEFITLNSDCPATINLQPNLVGYCFMLSFVVINALETKDVNVIQSTSTTTNNPVVRCSGVTYNSGTKVLTFSMTGIYMFYPTDSRGGSFIIYRIPQYTNISDVVGLQAELDNAVELSGNQTIAGDKTFSNNVLLSGLTADTALVADASKNITSSAVTSTELGFLSGVTSNIQDQIDAITAPQTIQSGVAYTNTGSVLVTFPSAYTVAPNVIVSFYKSVGSAPVAGSVLYVDSITTTQVAVTAIDGAGSPTSRYFTWMAIGN